jgi:hypothetical protein
MEWYQKQAKDSNDPEVARILEKMGGIDIKGGVKKKDMNQIVDGLEGTKLDDKKKK